MGRECYMAGIVRHDYRIFKIFKIALVNGANPVILTNALQDGLAYLFLLRRPKLVQFLTQLRATVREDCDREKRRIYRTRLANRERRDRNSAGHLNRGQKRIETVKGVALHRHAKYRQRCMRCKNAGQVGGPARCCYHNFQASRLRC